MLDAGLLVADGHFSAANNRELATLEPHGVEEVVKGASGQHNARPVDKSITVSSPRTRPVNVERMPARLQVNCLPSSGGEFSRPRM